MKITTIHIGIMVALLLGLALLGYSMNTTAVLGADRTGEVSLSNVQRFYHYSAFTATTTDATSTAISIAGADRVQVYFTRNGSTGTSTFEVEVSPDGTNWYNYNKLVSNVTNTNAQDITRVASLSIVGATSTSLYAVDIERDTFKSIRCLASFASTTLEAADSNTCMVSVTGNI